MKQAVYQCVCHPQHVWIGSPGPTQSPFCGCLYVLWLNYEKDFARHELPKENSSHSVSGRSYRKVQHEAA